MTREEEELNRFLDEKIENSWQVNNDCGTDPRRSCYSKVRNFDCLTSMVVSLPEYFSVADTVGQTKVDWANKIFGDARRLLKSANIAADPNGVTYECLFNLMAAVEIVSPLLYGIQYLDKKTRRKLARSRAIKSEKGEDAEQALQTAIRRVAGEGPFDHPYTTARRSQSRVSELLGRKPDDLVSVDSIARRLKK